MFRRFVLAGANTGVIARAVQRNGLSNSLVSRFVAGSTLDQALQTTRRLNDQGLTVALDLLGENVRSVDAVSSLVERYTSIIERVAESSTQAYISVKLTMLGLDQSTDLAYDSMRQILDEASQHGVFVRIDMEGSDYTERTMQIFTRLHDRYPEHVGIVIQSYLRRARADVERMIARKARVRLVKGAYAEPASVAFQSRQEVDESYRALMKLLLDGGNFPALATHDPALIADACTYALRHDIAASRFEFQMLYGVRQDAQIAIRRSGYGMRVYVPFGDQWYPYFSRRIAERPANALFVLRQLLP